MMVGYATIRKDMLEDDCLPSLLMGFPDSMMQENSTPLSALKFDYQYLEDDNPMNCDGFNMAIWLSDKHRKIIFVDLAYSIDFDFID